MRARFGAQALQNSVCRHGTVRVDSRWQCNPKARSGAGQRGPRERRAWRGAGVPAIQKMKTEFIDVSDTRKNLVVEIPSSVVDAEIDKVSHGLQQSRAHPRLQARQGPLEGGPPAVPRPDPARRRARADPTRRRRGVARAGRRAGQHPRHPRRRCRRRPAAEVHGNLRDRSADRSRATTRRSPCGNGPRRSARTRWSHRSRACASGRRATSRSRGAASTWATPC